MIKSIIKISKSIISDNKGIYFGLFFMYLFAVCIITLCTTIPDSVSTNVDKFIYDYNLADATVYTSPAKVDNKEDLYDENINSIDARLVVESKIKFDNKTRNVRVLSRSDDESVKYYFYDKSSEDDANEGLYITTYFAYANNIYVGDEITIPGTLEDKTYTITGIISTPESIKCCRDDTYWYENEDYGYIYMPRDKVDDCFVTSDWVNNFNIYFNDDTTYQQRVDSLSKFEEKLNVDSCESVLFEDSESKDIIKNTLSTLKSVCLYLPGIILLIVFVCSWLFFQQITRKQLKKVGLLKSLGYSNSSIINGFNISVFAVWLLSTIVGFAVSFVFDQKIMQAYELIFATPPTKILFSVLFPILVIVLLFTGLLSVFFNVKHITSVDPALTMTSHELASNIKAKSKNMSFKNIYSRISYGLLFQNKSRLVFSCFCIGATFVLIFCAIACIHARDISDTKTFEDRLNYDIQVWYDKDSDFTNKLFQQDYVDSGEEIRVYAADFTFNDEQFGSQVNGIQADSTLISPKNKSGDALLPTNGVIMDENLARAHGIKVGDIVDINGREVEVSDLAREYVNIVNYINYDSDIYPDEAEYGIAVKLNFDISDQQRFEDALSSISDIDGYKYFKIISHQRSARNNDTMPIYVCYYTICLIAFVIGIIILFNLATTKANERKPDNLIYLSLGVKLKNIYKLIFTESIFIYLISLIITVVPAYYIVELLLKKQSSVRGYMCFVDQVPIYLIVILFCLLLVLSETIFTFIKYLRLKLSIELNTID